MMRLAHPFKRQHTPRWGLKQLYFAMQGQPVPGSPAHPRATISETPLRARAGMMIGRACLTRTITPLPLAASSSMEACIPGRHPAGGLSIPGQHPAGGLRCLLCCVLYGCIQRVQHDFPICSPRQVEGPCLWGVWPRTLVRRLSAGRSQAREF